MKALMATAAGLVLLGGVFVVASGRNPSAPIAPQSAAAVATAVPPAVTPPVTPPVDTRTVVQERIVYRDRPAPVVARNTAPTSRRTAYRPVHHPRSWKKSAVIIGGSTAGGAGVGAVIGGSGGAKKGAVAGLLGGTIYDLATRNKH